MVPIKPPPRIWGVVFFFLGGVLGSPKSPQWGFGVLLYPPTVVLGSSQLRGGKKNLRSQSLWNWGWD